MGPQHLKLVEQQEVKGSGTGQHRHKAGNAKRFLQVHVSDTNSLVEHHKNMEEGPGQTTRSGSDIIVALLSSFFHVACNRALSFLWLSFYVPIREPVRLSLI